MPDVVCEKCNLVHAALNVELRGRTLIRRARRSHRLRVSGGAFGFSAQLIGRHADDIKEIVIRDLDSGEVFRADAKLLAHADRMTLNPAFGSQIILPLSAMTRSRWRPASMPQPQAPSPVQPEAAVAEPTPQQLVFGDPKLIEQSRRPRFRR